MFEGFPYTNFHELNLDWIIKIAKDFLDQYTNIQQTITQGLEDLDTKAEQLQALLDAWYEEHSEDIAQQLADALQGIDTALNNAITDFGRAAEAKAAETIESIPADYSELADTVLNIKRSLRLSCLFASNSYRLRLPAEFYTETGILATTGDVNPAQTDYKTTPFIDISICDKLTGTVFPVVAFAGLCLYDAAYSFLAKFNGTINIDRSDYPSAKYFRVSYDTTNPDDWFVVLSAEPKAVKDMYLALGAVDTVFNDFNRASTFNNVQNTHAFFLSTPIPDNTVIDGFDINTNTGTVNVFFANINGSTAVAYKEITFENPYAGPRHVDIEPFVTQGVTYFGFQGTENNVIRFRSTNDTSYGTLNFPVIEAEDTTNIMTTGAAVTFSNARFVYPVYIHGISFSKLASELEQASYRLNDGNILRYLETAGNVGYMGRWFDYSTGGNTYKATNNQGSEIYFKTIDAQNVTVEFGQITEQAVTPYIAYSVDGADFIRAQIDSPIVISLNNTSDNTEHIIRIIIDGMTEDQGGSKWDGTLGVYLKSVTVPSGSVKGLYPANRIGMFFGDSITEGINALGTGANAAVNSATGAFPFFCCKLLGAVSFRVGYGATGLFQVGSFNTCINAVNYLKNGLKVGSYEPDFIVINHGHNDSRSASEFKAAYEIVIQRLNILYPGKPVFMVSPFSKTTYDAVMKELAEQYPQCYFIATNDWHGQTTDGTHLSVAGAENNGAILANELIKILGMAYFMN